jgi:hypothetical protein
MAERCVFVFLFYFQQTCRVLVLSYCWHQGLFGLFFFRLKKFFFEKKGPILSWLWKLQSNPLRRFRKPFARKGPVARAKVLDCLCGMIFREKYLPIT